MSFFISEAWADAAAPAAQGTASPWSPAIMMGVVFVMMYFLMIRPQQKRQKEHQNLVGALQKGDEVVFAGGLLGRITKAEGEYLVLEISEGLEVKIQRSAVVATLPKGTIKNI